MKRTLLWKIEETVMKGLMIGATALALGSLLLILGTVVWKGLPAINLAMITQPPEGGYYTGAGGGILKAILGSLYLQRNHLYRNHLDIAQIASNAYRSRNELSKVLETKCCSNLSASSAKRGMTWL